MESSEDLSLGERIRAARLGKGLTLDELAAMTGVTKVAVWAWERGRTRPKAENLSHIAEALGTSAPVLFPDGRENAHSLHLLVSSCRRRIAEAAGLGVENIEITIHFGRNRSRQDFDEC
jgi:transcriptional regulator with XRE-family HTH domain